MNVKESQFSTKYVHEISSHWGIEIVDPFNSLVSVESKEKFKKLLDFMTPYLKTGDYFELYSCWVGEEWETRNGILNLKIEEININSLEIPEKTLVIIKK